MTHVPSFPAKARVDDGERPEVIIRAMMTPYSAVDAFLNDGLRRGWSTRTLTTYRRILEAFADRLPVDYDITDVKEDDVRRYLGTFNGRARGTIAHAEAVLSSFFRWCYLCRKVKANPMDRLQRTKRIPPDELDVTTVSTEDVPKLLVAARVLDARATRGASDGECWTYRVCLMVLVYLGPRRRAVSRLRRRDWDKRNQRMRFREKGDKIIWKRVPDALQAFLREADAAGVWGKPTDFLVPPEFDAHYARKVLDGREDRDDRCVWRIVKNVGAEAGVETHVHALRAAFAVFYLKTNPGDINGLQKLLGHRSIATTAIYLRKLEAEQAMDRVRGLEWEAA